MKSRGMGDGGWGRLTAVLLLLGVQDAFAQDRPHRLFVPTPAPRGGALVVMLHGCVQTPDDIARAGRFDSLAQRAGVIVLYPEQPASANPIRCWNWFVPAHQAREGGEPASIAALTREIASRHGVDPRRIHIGGLSAGGAMAVLTALAWPDLFASVAADAGLQWRSATGLADAGAAMRGEGPDPSTQGRLAYREMGAHARALPLLVIQGMADTLVRPAAARQLVAQFAGLNHAAGIHLTADTTRGSAGGLSYLLERYRDPSGKVMIEAWLIDELGHALPGGSAEVRYTDPRGPDAAREMLRFFLEHPKL